MDSYIWSKLNLDVSHCTTHMTGGIKRKLFKANSQTAASEHNVQLKLDSLSVDLMGVFFIWIKIGHGMMVVVSRGFMPVTEAVFHVFYCVIIHFCLCFCFFPHLFLQTHLPNIKVHAYFAPVTPPPSVGGNRQRFCRCCVLLWCKDKNPLSFPNFHRPPPQPNTSPLNCCPVLRLYTTCWHVSPPSFGAAERERAKQRHGVLVTVPENIIKISSTYMHNWLMCKNIVNC